METIYKIRSKTTGLFSRGGKHPRWNKKGKVWKRKSDISNHLAIVDDYGRRYGVRANEPYKDAEIVEFEIIETSTAKINDWLKEAQERSRKREDDRKRRMENWLKERRLQQYEELKKEFGQ